MRSSRKHSRQTLGNKWVNGTKVTNYGTKYLGHLFLLSEDEVVRQCAAGCCKACYFLDALSLLLQDLDLYCPQDCGFTRHSLFTDCPCVPFHTKNIYGPTLLELASRQVVTCDALVRGEGLRVLYLNRWRQVYLRVDSFIWVIVSSRSVS